MWKNYKLWIGVVLAIFLLGGGFYYYRQMQQKSQTTSYTTGTVEKGTISTKISATGTINPVNYVDISTNVAGTLEQVLVKENEYVEKGQVIAYIDDTALKATANDALATLNNKKADYDRYAMLVNQNAISQQTFDNAKTAYLQAQEAYDKASYNLSQTEITSPMSGTIIGTPLKAGQTISTGLSSQMIIATVANLDNLEIYLTVDETDIGAVAVGQNVTFTVDAFTDKTFTGTVSAISKGTKGNMGTTSSSVVYYTVKVAIPTSEAASLLPTMTARASIIGREVKDTLVVPLTAIRSDKAGQYVYKIVDGKPTRQAITTGITGDTNIQILKGLAVGDEIVVSGNVTSGSTSSSGGRSPMPF